MEVSDPNTSQQMIKLTLFMDSPCKVVHVGM